MNRNALKTNLSMTRHFALTVAENQLFESIPVLAKDRRRKTYCMKNRAGRQPTSSAPLTTASQPSDHFN
jgi:hypothetical protein